MRVYRICCMDSSDRIRTSFNLSCRDDLEALSEAESICDDGPVEVWEGAKLVARVKAKNASLTPEDRKCL